MMLCSLLSVLMAPLLTLPVDGRPLRFGFSVPAAALTEGLSLTGRGVLQWRRLPLAKPDAEEVWIEVAIVAPRGTVRIVRGGAGPCADRRGPAFVFTSEDVRLAHGWRRVSRWQWVDGTVDERVHTTFTMRTVLAGETFEIGEGLTKETPGLAERAGFWRTGGRRHAVRCGLLPALGRGIGTARRVRRHLRQLLPRLVEMRGQRGAGDFRRSNGEVTNLEFDTTLALLRCAVAFGDERAWQMAVRSAGHLRDRDLDMRSGLPFLHGVRHRGGMPEPGHVWLQGLLWVGLLSADDDAVTAARAIGRALAARLPMGTGRRERLRDYAWPLLELEALLVVDGSARLAIAADRLAMAIALRFDPAARTFRFGEGELGGGVYLERAWLTAGLLLPALRSHLQRRPVAELQQYVETVQKSLLDRLGTGAKGLPTHWRVVAGRVLAVHYERRTARSAWLLEALSDRQQRRMLARSSVRRAFEQTPDFEHPDLATEFTLLARCRWVWR